MFLQGAGVSLLGTIASLANLSVKTSHLSRGGEGEDKMAGWHHSPNVREFKQTPGDGGQGSLVCLVHGVKRVRQNLATE